MKLRTAWLIALLAATHARGEEALWAERLAFWSWGTLQKIETKLRAIDDELAALPELAMINSSLSIGLKTGLTTTEDVRWLEIELDEEAKADTVVLVPPLAKAATAVVAGYGFPVRFVVEVTDAAGHSHVIRDASREEFPNPGGHPVVIRFPERPVKMMRLTATEPWAYDGPDVLAMAEVYLLSGNRNLAAGAAVASSSTRNAPRSWTRANLVDEVTPLGLPLVPQTTGRPGFHSSVADDQDTEKWVTVSLPEPMPVDEVVLVPARVKEVPLWFGYGFPQRYRVEAALQEDFSDATVIADRTSSYQYSPGMNLVRIPNGRSMVQHVRLTATQLWYRQSDYVFALAEMQLLRNGENMALGAAVTASDASTNESGMTWEPEQLTDGLTSEGRLLNLPEWFRLLERRRVLDAERGVLVQQRTGRLQLARQQLVYGSVGSLGGVTLLSLAVLFRQQRQRRRDAQRLQEKLARDLHDEIGSNLGSIAMICSLADEPNATPDSLRADLAEIGHVAAESADSMRDMVQLISPRHGSEEAHWLEVLRRLCGRLLRGMSVVCDLPDQPLPLEPDVETRRELYLFCKEVLHNIARHSSATRARLRIQPSANGLRIHITDNGVGFDPAQTTAGHGLGNLQERATVLAARMHLFSKPGAGTVVRLDVPATNRWKRS